MTEEHRRGDTRSADSDTDGSVTVEWRLGLPHALDPPLVTQLPYLEVTLEYPGLEPTRFDDTFFPDAVPYQLGDERRVFYWRRGIQTERPLSATWRGACATPHELEPVSAGGVTPTLTRATDIGWEVVVDGTVAGGATATVVSDLSPPSIRVRTLSTDVAVLSTPTGPVRVGQGDRTTVPLPEETVTRVEPETLEVTVDPELTVRFPGVRTLYHPAIGSRYALFPSFGLDLDGVSNPLDVPTAGGELDHERLEGILVEDPADRPYAERVLWQAFCHTAFDPHRESPALLTQFDDGTIAVRS